MNVTSIVVVPFRRPFVRDVPPDWVTSVFNDIIAATPEVTVVDHWGGSGPMVATELRQPTDIPQYAAAWRASPFFSYRHLAFTSTVDVDIDEVSATLESNNPGTTLNTAQRDSLITQMSAEAFDQSVCHVLLAAQIARPGSFLVDDRIVITEIGHSFSGGSMSLIFDGARQRSKRIGWPIIDGVAVEDAVKWLIGIPGLVEGEPSGPAGRAVSALSNLIMRAAPASEDPTGLMWCMVGLEAIYGEGQASLKQQLVQKSRLVLGQPQAWKKAVGDMYDFRSRFIHGDVNFPLGYAYSSDQYSFTDEVAESVQLALAVLVATLQEMVRRNLYEFGFEYRLSEDPNAPGTTGSGITIG